MEGRVRIQTSHSLVGAIVSLAMFVAAAPAGAQDKLNVVAGLNLASAIFDPSVSSVFQDSGFDSAKSTGVKGFAAGVSFVHPVSDRVNLQLEGLFSRGGNRIKAVVDDFFGTGVVEQTLTINTLEIPVLASIPLGDADRASVQAGVFLGFKVSQSETFKVTADGETFEDDVTGDDRTDIKTGNFGIAVGAEVHVTPKISVGGRFSLGLTNIDNENFSGFDSIKTRSFRVYAVIGLR